MNEFTTTAFVQPHVDMLVIVGVTGTLPRGRIKIVSAGEYDVRRPMTAGFYELRLCEAHSDAPPGQVVAVGSVVTDPDK